MRNLIIIAILLMLAAVACEAEEQSPDLAPTVAVIEVEQLIVTADTISAKEEPTNTSELTITNTPEPTTTQRPTETKRPTDTPIAPTETPTQTHTPTAIPISEELKLRIEQTYRTLIMIQLNTELLNETASLVQSGELQGLELAASTIALVGLVDSVEQVKPSIEPPSLMVASWTDALNVHEQTKDIVRRWLNKEIQSPQVLVETEPLQKEIEDIVGRIEVALGNEFQFDSELLERQRLDIIQLVEEFYENPDSTDN